MENENPNNQSATQPTPDVVASNQDSILSISDTATENQITTSLAQNENFDNQLAAPQVAPNTEATVTENAAKDLTIKIKKKIQRWKIFSLVIGLIAFFGFFICYVIFNYHTDDSWAASAKFAFSWLLTAGALLLVLLISLLRTLALSIRRKKHFLVDYAVIILGAALVVSPPFLIIKLSQVFNIYLPNDNNKSFSIKLKTKDPYHFSTSRGSSMICDNKVRTSNELKQTYDLDDPDDKDSYFDSIGDELICQIDKFYKKNMRYPNEEEFKKIANEMSNDDVRSGAYNLKMENKKAPNSTDFVVMFNNKCGAPEEKRVSVFSPIYGKKQRVCSYGTVGEKQINNDEDKNN